MTAVGQNDLEGQGAEPPVDAAPAWAAALFAKLEAKQDAFERRQVAAANAPPGNTSVHPAMLEVVQRSEEEKVKKKWDERPQEIGKRPAGAAEYDVKDVSSMGVLTDLATTNWELAEKISETRATESTSGHGEYVSLQQQQQFNPE